MEPGFTKTDLNHNTGIQTVEEGAEIIVRMAQVAPDGPTGGYFDGRRSAALVTLVAAAAAAARRPAHLRGSSSTLPASS
ncbi:hypothetical protein GCM10020220_051380 [Nonomuraea rubra]